MVACLFYVVYNIHNKNVYSIEKTGGYTVREIRLKARAKINLTLDVTGKREDGYHLLETIMQTVALYDGIYMKKLEKPVIKLLHIDTVIQCYRLHDGFQKMIAVLPFACHIQG